MFKTGLQVGATGDIALQIANRYDFGNDGLRSYFATQNPVVSVAKAALLTGVWSGAYEQIAGTRASFASFAVWAAAVDLLYRYEHPVLYPTLEDYYEQNHWAMTILYNVVTAGLVWTARPQ